MTLLLDLADAVRKSGLIVDELDGWKDNFSAGGEAYIGVSIHHTGSYDDEGDTSSDEAYARWMAFTGRDVSGDGRADPPLCNLALSAESRVFVCASGNANGVGQARASGPMPAASDGNRIYIVIEAMNSGTQGWATKGRDADGNGITQYKGYARLCAALCLHYAWSADVVRAHWETSVTGKWDPGDPRSGAGPDGRSMDMNKFRAAVAWWMNNLEDPMAGITLDQIEERVREAVRDELQPVLKAVRQQVKAVRARLREESVDLDAVAADVDQLLELVGEG